MADFLVRLTKIGTVFSPLRLEREKKNSRERTERHGDEASRAGATEPWVRSHPRVPLRRWGMDALLRVDPSGDGIALRPDAVPTISIAAGGARLGARGDPLMGTRHCEPERCFACGRPMLHPRLVDTRDAQTVYVGRCCGARVTAAGDRGYQPKLGGPRLYALVVHWCRNKLPESQRRIRGRKGKKQTTRMLKVQCPACGYLARVTRKWLEEAGTPTCPCGERMVER